MAKNYKESFSIFKGEVKLKVANEVLAEHIRNINCINENLTQNIAEIILYCILHYVQCHQLEGLKSLNLLII